MMCAVIGAACVERAGLLGGVLVFFLYIQSSVAHATTQQAAAKGLARGGGVQVEGQMIRRVKTVAFHADWIGRLGMTERGKRRAGGGKGKGEGVKDVGWGCMDMDIGYWIWVSGWWEG